MREVVAVAAATAALRRAKQAQLGVDEPRARRHLQVSKIEAEVANPLPHVLVGENHELVVVDGVVAVRQRARHRGEHDSALHTLPRRQTPGGPVGPHQRRAGQAGCALQPTRAPRSRSLPGQAGLARRPRDHPAHASGERGGDEEQAPHLAEHLFLVVGLRCCCRPASLFERRRKSLPADTVPSSRSTNFTLRHRHSDSSASTALLRQGIGVGCTTKRRKCWAASCGAFTSIERCRMT